MCLPGPAYIAVFLPPLIYAFYDYATFLSFSKRTLGRARSGCEREARRTTNHYLPLSLSLSLSLSLFSNTTPPLSRFTDKSIATVKLPVEIPRVIALCSCSSVDVSAKAGNDRGVPHFPREFSPRFLFDNFLSLCPWILQPPRVTPSEIHTECFARKEFGERRGTFKVRNRKSRQGPKSSSLPETRGTSWKARRGGTGGGHRIKCNAARRLHRSDRSQYKHTEATTDGEV